MVRFLVGAIILAVLGLPSLSNCDEKPGSSKSDTPPIDPTGRPVLRPKQTQDARYLIWHSDGEWHLRTRSTEDFHAFRGTITALDGKFTSVANYDALENKRGKKVQDVGKLNDGRDRIAFKFKTSVGEDGFDFTPGPNVTQLEFDLKIDEALKADRVFIGAKARNPEKGKFLLPAKPASSKDR